MSYNPNVAYLARWGGQHGVGSQEAGAGVPLQEAGSNRSGGDAVGPGLGGGGVPVV